MEIRRALAGFLDCSKVVPGEIMKTVWKFGIGEVEMPEGAVILRVGIQTKEWGNVACLWAEVNHDAPRVNRKFKMFGTGQLLPNNCLYIGGFQEVDLEWHVYEIFDKELSEKEVKDLFKQGAPK